MLMRNAVTASKNANCFDFSGYGNTIIPIFHSKKHASPLITTTNDECTRSKDIPNYQGPEINLMLEHLVQEKHSEFTANVLFYIAGFITSKLLMQLTCHACKESLVSEIFSPSIDHDYCGASRYNEAASASAFTLFINKGGLRIPSKLVFETIEYSEHVFKAYVCKKDCRRISNDTNLQWKMIPRYVITFFSTQANLCLKTTSMGQTRVWLKMITR